MALRCLCFVLLLLIISANSGKLLQYEINQVLEQLNRDAKGYYQYNDADVVDWGRNERNRQLWMWVEIQGECVLEDENSCSSANLTCQTIFTLENETGKYQLVETSCTPKNAYEPAETTAAADPMLLSYEITSAEPSEEPFVAVRKDSHLCLGCPFDLNPNVEGIEELVDTTLKHVELERSSKYALVKVRRIQQQVVAGTKYILVVEIAPTDCSRYSKLDESCTINTNLPTEICEVVFWYKPWVTKVKPITSNNCTISQEYVPMEATVAPINERENEVDGDLQPFGEESPYNADWLAELESQIIRDETDAAVNHPTVDLKTVQLQEAKNPVTEFAATTNVEPAVFTDNLKSATTTMPTVSEGLDSSSSSESVTEKNSENGSSESSSNESARNTRSVTPLEKITAEDRPLVVQLAEVAAISLDNIDDDNHRRIVLQILGAKKMKLEGTLYHLTLRIGVSHCLEGEWDEKCKEKLFENLTKICKVQIHVSDDHILPRVLKSQCQTIKKDNSDINRTSHNRFKRQLLGGRVPIDTKSPIVQELISGTLQQLDGESSADTKLKIVEVISATRQIVAGSLYKIKVKLVQSTCSKNSPDDPNTCEALEGAEPQECEIKIWDQPWLPNGRKTDVMCGDQPKQSFRSKREIISDSFEPYNLESQFQDFIQKHNKKYKNKKEYNYRFKIFQQNVRYIDFLNENEQGTATYGITKFADLTRKEFAKKHLGLRPDLGNENNIPLPEAKIPNIKLPTEFDWRTKGVVSEVKDQGSCGSCWAFSVTGNVEGQYAIKHGQLLEFSEQELVDCDKIDEGCNGGLMDNAYRAIEKLGGLETEKDYPYDAEDEKCHFNKTLSKVQLSGALNISQNETDMAKWLVKNGPISIAINANAMQFYVGGVSHPWKYLCNPKNLDHGVLIVGYGVHSYPYFKKSLPYWIVKNSWGPSWGEQGYYRVYRGDGTCGLNQTPSSAIVE